MKSTIFVLFLTLILSFTLIGCGEKSGTTEVYSVKVENSISITSLVENTSGELERQFIKSVAIDENLEVDSISFLSSSFGEFPYLSEEIEVSEEYAVIVQDIMNETSGDILGGSGADVSYGHKAKIEINLINHSYGLTLEFYTDSNEDFVQFRVIYYDNFGYVESTTYTDGYDEFYIKLLDLYQ